MALRFNLVTFEDQKNLTLVHNGEMFVADSNHPNWDSIYKAVVVEEDANADFSTLFNPEKTVSENFKKVSERVSVANGVVYFDGDPVDNSLTKQILRFLEEGVDDWKPLVFFMEKVYTNPDVYSRDQFYEFLLRHEWTIMSNGDVLAYKGVNRGEDGVFYSTHSGTAVVNGEVHNGFIPQRVGDVVEMPRSSVAANPHEACSTGLHVSRFDYAKTYGDSVLSVVFNPRDAVSVPNDASYQKIRVCRYEVDDEVSVPVESVVHYSKTVDDSSVPQDDEDDSWSEDSWDDDGGYYSSSDYSWD